MESANRESTNRESVKREDTFAEVCSRKFTYQGYTYATLTLALTKIFEAKDRSAWKICNICCNALVSQSGENQNLLQEQMLRFSINYRPIHVHTRAITTSRPSTPLTLTSITVTERPAYIKMSQFCMQQVYTNVLQQPEAI